MMNGRHMPAGPQQNMQQDMGRRRQHQYNQAQQYQQPPPIYNGYMQQPYVNYYPQHVPPQYQNAGTPYQYGPYAPPLPPPHVRSPPPLQHYAPIPQPQQYPRPQPSPAVSTHYQAPPLAQTPPSTQSSYAVPGPMTPPTPTLGQPVVASSPQPKSIREPFRAPLPWLSSPDSDWPARRPRRKKKQALKLSSEAVELPSIQSLVLETESFGQQKSSQNEQEETQAVSVEVSTPRPETPSESHRASEAGESTNPTTPSSIQHPPDLPTGDITPVAPKQSRAAVPIIPIQPAIPKVLPKDNSKANLDKPADAPPPMTNALENFQSGVAPDMPESNDATSKPADELKEAAPPTNAWSKPKSWTGLFNSESASSHPAKSGDSSATASTFSKTGPGSLADALRSFDVTSNEFKVTFLEPRGLVNTGNMCYMNSILQVLVFCAPFYNFLDLVGKRAAYSFKSETPLIDAMIMFMREYPVIDSATSVEKLRLRLKDGEFEQYGEAFTPDFVYDVMKRLPRFVSMQRGHQQDAEEFLGFLLDGLHEECVHIMQSTSSNGTSAVATPAMPSSPTSESASVSGSAKENGWLEVGPKQKAAVTRSSGAIITSSPLTKIFGGTLRSELRVPGLKDSITLEPFQPLQLDIGAPNVHNIVDALKGLTRSEVLHGDFKSPKGPNVTATKQVFIDTIPPVLILHLKRFQYDNAGGTQKIWKKVGYPLELEIPKEVFTRQKRASFPAGGLPKYRLMAAVYHHGKNASGGHYTVDVGRQDGREWIRLDDTVIRRVRSEDVAEGGSEEDPKVLAAAAEAHKKDGSTSSNVFSTIEDESEAEADAGWKQANGPGKKWSSVVNGAPPPKSKAEKFSAKDNKVAYLLFYQQV